MIAALTLADGAAADDVSNAPLRAEGEGFSFDLGLAAEYLDGYSRYEIKGSEFLVSWKSRLEWPLDSLLIGPDAAFRFADNRFALNLAYRTNVTDSPGELKDYNWLYGAKSVYSRVDTDLTAHIADANLVWNFLRGDLTAGAGAGYRFEYFDWDGEGVLTETYYNWNFDIPPGTYTSPSAKWITYKINYHLPYLIVNGDYRFDEMFSVRLFSKVFLVIASDEDDHVQRQKLCESDYAGLGFSAGGEGRFDFSSDIYLTLFIDYTYLSADGDQDQSFYGGEDAGEKFKNIDARTESLQASTGISVGFSF